MTNGIIETHKKLCIKKLVNPAISRELKKRTRGHTLVLHTIMKGRDNVRNEIMLVTINTEYCNYLRKYDERVPYNFDKKSVRPFVGVLFMIGDCKYFAPLSSPKPKHLKLKNKLDFLRIDDGKLDAVNFNNMIPVYDNNIKVIDFSISECNKEEKQYYKLLNKQFYWLTRNSKKLYYMSRTLYDLYVKNNLSCNIKDRCCNFSLLEEKCMEYNGSKILQEV